MDTNLQSATSNCWALAILALEVCEETSSRKVKESTLRTCPAQDKLQQIVTAAYDWKTTYGIIWSEVGVSKPYDDQEALMSGYFLLLDRLAKRELTGDRAYEAVKAYLEGATTQNLKWMVRILNRDLRIGCNVTTFNKVWPGSLTTYECSLCDHYEAQDVSKGWLAEPKLDGLRAQLGVFNGGSARVAISRNGKELFNLEHVIEELNLIDPEGKYVFDGEAMALDWNQSASILHSQAKHIDAKELKFFLFDVVRKEDWGKKGTGLSLRERKQVLYDLLCEYDSDFAVTGKLKNSSLIFVSGKVVTTPDEVWAEAKAYRNDGFEGTVVKDPGSLYEYDRSKGWLKAKFQESSDFEIVGCYPGTGKNVNRLGGFVLNVGKCRYCTNGQAMKGDPDGSRYVGDCDYCNGLGHDECRVGTGISDKQRDELWLEYQSGGVVGLTAEVEFQERTKDGMLRFPTILRIRRDK